MDLQAPYMVAWYGLMPTHGLTGSLDGCLVWTHANSRTYRLLYMVAWVSKSTQASGPYNGHHCNHHTKCVHCLAWSIFSGSSCWSRNSTLVVGTLLELSDPKLCLSCYAVITATIAPSASVTPLIHNRQTCRSENVVVHFQKTLTLVFLKELLTLTLLLSHRSKSIMIRYCTKWPLACL